MLWISDFLYKYDFDILDESEYVYVKLMREYGEINAQKTNMYFIRALKSGGCAAFINVMAPEKRI